MHRPLKVAAAATLVLCLMAGATYAAALKATSPVRVAAQWGEPAADTLLLILYTPGSRTPPPAWRR